MLTNSDTSQTVNSATSDTTDASSAGMFENFKTWSAKAQSLVADDEVRPLRLEPELIYFNLRKGISVITPYRSQLATEMASISFDDIGTLTAMCQAMMYADNHAERVPPAQPATDNTETIAQGHKIRRGLVNKLVVAADEGLVEQSVVDEIRRGSGPLDMANDNIELARIFAQNPAMAARMNVSSADIKAANDIGVQIIDIVKPKRAFASADAADTQQREAAVARDRIWTLVERVWERNVWRAGACIFGRDVEKHIPLLGSGQRGRKAVEPTPAPTPTPAPAPAPSPSPAPAPIVTADAAEKDPHHGG